VISNPLLSEHSLPLIQIQLARDKGTHSTCDICLNKDLMMISKDIDEPTKREVILPAFLEHIKQEQAQRTAYHANVHKALTEPDKYLSIIIDAYDNKKSVLPYFKGCPKSLEGKQRIAMKVMQVRRPLLL